MSNPFLLLLTLVLTLIAACAAPSPEGEEAAALATTEADTYRRPTSGPDDRWRPAYHFTPPEQWMNDPNGMVFFDGEYHLFYQHYPDSNVWGPMHWGHAISTDLIDWKHLPIALYPDSLGYIFSGSAVIDWKNTTGFGTEENPPMIAIFTHHDAEGADAGRNDIQYQSIAYSTDRGRNWTKYAGNPVIPNPVPNIRDFRDPKVIWDEDSEQWVMIFAAQDRARFYGSPDLKSWTYLSEWGQDVGAHGGVWECPDLFPMEMDGTGEKKWVLIQSLNPGGPNGGSGTQYFVGDFDGRSFTLDPAFADDVQNGDAVWIDHGRDNYAGVTWSDIPKEDGRRIFLGWMSNWQYANVVPTTTWRSAMTLPRSLTLRQTAEGPRLFSKPVRELEALRGTARQVSGVGFKDRFTLLEAGTDFSPAVSELELVLDLAKTTAEEVAVRLANDEDEVLLVGYDRTRNAYFTDRRAAGLTDFDADFATGRHYAPRRDATNELRLHIFLDRASVEVFADDGRTVLTDIFFVTEPLNQVEVIATGGNARLVNVTLWPLQLGEGK